MRNNPEHKQDGSGDLSGGNHGAEWMHWLTGGWRAYVWIVVLALLAFVRTLTFDYTYSDDDYYVLARHEFNSKPANIGKAFTEKYTGVYYRPVVTLSLMWDAVLGGTRPFMPHLTNLLIHLGVCFVLLRLARRLGLPPTSAFLLTAIFAVHPLATQPVAWIMGRNDSLAALWVLLSFLFFLEWIDEKRTAALVLHLLFFTLALFTKEIALILPLICMVYAILVRGMSFAALRERMPAAIGWGGVLVIWFLLRADAVAGAFNPSTFGFRELAANILVIPDIVGKVFLFSHQAPFSVVRSGNIFALGVLLVWIVTLVRVKAQRKEAWFGLIWFLLFMAPTLFTRLKVANDLYDYLECRAYLPMVGVFFSVFWLGRFRRPAGMWGPVLTGLILCLLIYRTYHTSLDYENRLTYYGSAVRSAPEKALIRYNYAKALKAGGMEERAKEEYEKSIALAPGHADFYTDLADIYYRKGDFGTARELNMRALSINPRHTLALTNEGIRCEWEGLADSAISLWLRAVDIDPEYLPAWENYFRSLVQRQQYSDAVVLVGERERSGKKLSTPVARIFAYYFHFAQGRDQYGQRNYSAAMDHYRKALAIRANSVEANLDLGAVYFATGNLVQAVEINRHVLTLDSNNALAHANLGVAYNAQGNPDAALEEWRKAASLDTGLAAPIENLFRYYLNRNRLAEAAPWAERLRRKGVPLDPELVRSLNKQKERGKP